VKLRTEGITFVSLFLIVTYAVLAPHVGTSDWLNWLGPFALAAVVTFGVMPTLLWLARRWALLDRPDSRKHHEGEVPLVGGIAIFAGFLVSNLRYGYYTISPELRAVVLASALLLVVGVLDDRYDLSAVWKLLVQMGAAAIVIAGGVRVTFLPAVWWGDLLELAVTAVWLIGLTNALNFLDGIDGLATSMTLVAVVAFGMVAVQTGQHFFLLLCAALAGGCLAFLPFNFGRRPATAFLGDAGATLLGFLLASLAVFGEWGGAGGTLVDIAVPLLILGVPIFDTTFITLTRIADGRIRTVREWLEYTGRDHIHHRLLSLGLSRHDAVGFLCTISAVLALSAVTLKSAEGYLAGLSLLQGAIILTIVGRFMLFVENRSR
jgi:UDP-GlcNAc:undecaprenyl-phosphate GlcNAc-1-phosphate transferase